MSQKVVISCFDHSTNFVQPWADAGYRCFCIDLRHPYGETRTGNISTIGADMLDWLPRKEWDVAFAAFFPPCTDLAISGARHFKDKGLGSLIDALTLFKRSVDIAESLGCPYFLENPSSTVSTYWRKPDYVFDPCDYGDPYTKRTCLWTGGGFKMPPKFRVEPTEGSWAHRKSGAGNRAVTPLGFSRAAFKANSIIT